MNSDLKKIKKKYGEKMAHLCRELFPTILETEGLLLRLITLKFNEDKSLYDSLIKDDKIENFKNYIYSLIDVENNDNIKDEKTPTQLLKENGYTLFECKTQEEILSFERFYKKEEKLCTFNGNRLKSCHVFFAVKDNVKDIKREDFSNPTRQDGYGTSVISIQFSKGRINTLSIKNRYNHRVNNPDATFSNNLENIAEGLTESFEREYNLNINSNRENFELPGFTLGNDKKYYRYNYEMNNIYYCPNNIIIDNGEVKKLDKSKYLLVDYFIINLENENKGISLYDNSITDSFLDITQNIENIKINNEKNAREITLKKNDYDIINMKIDENGEIIYLNLPSQENIGVEFLHHNRNLTEINMPKVKIIGQNFLEGNEALTEIDMPEVTVIDYGFLYNNKRLAKIHMPKAKTVGQTFLRENEALTKIDMPEVTVIGHSFLYNNKRLAKIHMPKAKTVGQTFLRENEALTEIDMPEVTVIDYGFLYNNKRLAKIHMPKAKTVDQAFLMENETLTEIHLPEARTIGDGFIENNEQLTTIYIPRAKTIGNSFLERNKCLTEIDAPKVTIVGYKFLHSNKNISNINMPKLTIIGNEFLYNNKKLLKISLPKAKTIGYKFLFENVQLYELNLPKVATIKDGFLYNNKELIKLNMSKLTTLGYYFLYNNEKIIEVNLPKVMTIYKGFLENNPNFLPQQQGFSRVRR